MPSRWRGRRQWPPSPSVEDEVDSLAHELASTTVKDKKGDNEEARSRGTVDQYPIILDVDLPSSKAPITENPTYDRSSVKSRSSDESLGPTTPPNSSSDRRYVFIPSDGVQIPLSYDNEKESKRRDVSGNLSGSEHGRGRSRRPSIHPIDTNLGGDLQGIASGRRRAPSPYAYTKPEKSEKEKINRFSSEVFLSPETATPTHRLQNLDSKRHSSARPAYRNTESSDSSDTGKHHEKQKSSRRSFSRAERPSLVPLDGYEKRAASYSYPKPYPSPLSKTLHDDEKRSRHEKKPGKLESPYISSAEEARLRPQDPLKVPTGRRSRASSSSKPERPRLDIWGSRYSYDGANVIEKKDENRRRRKDVDPSRHYSVYDGRSYLEQSSSGRSPMAMEDEFEKAFQHNKTKRYASPLNSPNVSPYASPPRTPPRTPQGDEKRASTEYFPAAVPVPATRSRPPSREETRKSDLKPLTPAGTPYSTAPISSLDIRPVARVDTFPSTKITGHRSRNASPLPSPTDERPTSRAGSYTPMPMVSPKIAQRAFSYSSDDDRRRRPSKLQTSTASSYLAQPPPPPRPWRSNPSSVEKVPQLPPHHPTPAQLQPCPRSKPIAGYHDWYTIMGLSQIDICPSCMSQIGGSRFRDYFVPSLPKQRHQAVRCALSHPWIRMAWLQTINKQRNNLDLLQKIIQLPATSKPCPGEQSEVRSWYRIPDPETGTPVPNFDACSTCVRSIEIVMPQLKGVFKRGGSLVQERTCDLRCDSKRFPGYLDLLDAAAIKYEQDREMRYPDMRDFAAYARRVARLRECRKGDLLIGQAWHFMPQLPEFTICEECFDEVVWPVANLPVAKQINRTLQLLPGPTGVTGGVSCQLYSERMRGKFLEAVKYGDFEYLKSVALRRHGVERLLQERHQMFMRDVAMGKERTKELERNVEEWKKWE